ncbi:MAG: hypothetical protein JXO22_09965, partial [Phycisphaerae bacterium]|nr:hypothetical protein [Phycisphaerae bacterium]
PKLPKAVQERIHAAEEGGSASQSELAEPEQTVCPVMGNEIDHEVFTDYRGVRVYFCCPPCIAKFKSNPEQYIPKLPQVIQDRIASANREEAESD